MNYVFYDFETSGINLNFDQPIQIAAALVDEDFKIIDEFNYTCKLKDGVVPNPTALLVNKVKITQLKNDISFYEMMEKVNNKFEEWSPATFIGYNSIWFDEEVLRNSLFQSLYDPYITNTKQNCRGDLFKIVLALIPLDLNLIKVPINPKTDKPSYKLEALAKANNILHETAHDAMSDVIATIGLAELIKNKNKEFWEECMNSISHDLLLNHLTSDEYFFAAPTHTNSAKLTPLVLLTSNPNYKKELAFFDLNHKIEDHEEARVSAIYSLIESKQKIIKLLKSNKAPILFSRTYIKNNPCFKDTEFDKLSKEADKAKSSTSFIDNLNQALVDRLDDFQVNQPQPEYLEKTLYSGFSGPTDRLKMKNFRNEKDPKKKYKISNEFEDKRLKEISKRIIYSEYPDELTDNERDQRQAFIARKVFDEEKDIKVEWCTIKKAKEAINNLRENEKFKNEEDYINEIEEYIIDEERRYKKYLIS